MSKTLLDQVREGVIPVSVQLVELLLRAKDHVGKLLESGQSGQAPPTNEEAELVQALTALGRDFRASRGCRQWRARSGGGRE